MRVPETNRELGTSSNISSGRDPPQLHQVGKRSCPMGIDLISVALANIGLNGSDDPAPVTCVRAGEPGRDDMPQRDAAAVPLRAFALLAGGSGLRGYRVGGLEARDRDVVQTSSGLIAPRDLTVGPLASEEPGRL